MSKFQSETPKGLLKEGWNFDEEGEGHSLWIEKELEDLHLAGNIDTQTLNKALDYVSDNDYELYADNLDANYVLKQVTGVREGNAFTAGLAKTKKGGEFEVGGKKFKDRTNYDAPVKEYQFDQMYQDDPGPFESEMEESGHGDEPFDFVKSAIESTSGDKISHTEEDSNGRSMYRSAENPNVTYYLNNHEQIIKHDSETGERYSIGDLRHYDEPTHDYEPDTDADYEEPGDDFDMAKARKLQERAGIKSQDDGPEDDDEEREKKAKKAEMDDEEAENAEREIDEEAHADGSHMRNPDTAAKVVAEKHGAELKPLYDKYQAARKDPDHKVGNAAWKEYQNEATSWCGHEMLEAGMKRVVVGNLLSGYGYFEDWLSDYMTAIGKELGGITENIYEPLQKATGVNVGITKEESNDANPPYGFSVLSPDERKQLKEYIESLKTIKKEISSLLEKAGKSSMMENDKAGYIKGGEIKNKAKVADTKRPAEIKPKYNNPEKKQKPGGNRTDLVMNKGEMWENEDQEHDTIEDSLGEKLHTAFHKVTDLAIQKLVADGWDEDVVVNFLQREIEEKAKEAINAQHDF